MRSARGHLLALQKLSLKFYEERQTGRIVARVVDDSSSIHALVTGASVTLFSDLITAVGVFIWLFWLHWGLALASVALTPLLVMNYLWHRRRMRMESRRHLRNWHSVVGFLNERVANNRVVRAFATESTEEDVFRSPASRPTTSTTTASSGAIRCCSPARSCSPASGSSWPSALAAGSSARARAPSRPATSSPSSVT
ncbi:MAG: ABC transporter ATP-binding protein [Verrucomicrobiota bacterium]